LAEGELAVDADAGLLFVGDSSGNTVSLVESPTSAGTLDGQTVRWDDTDGRWEATSDLLIEATTGDATFAADVTIEGNLQSTGITDVNATEQVLDITNTGPIWGNQDAPVIQQNLEDETFHTILGGFSENTSAAMTVFGPSHPTKANDIDFTVGLGSTPLAYDHSETKWTFGVGDSVSIQGDFETVGMTDNSTVKNWVLNNSALEVGVAGVDFSIYKADPTRSLVLSGGTSSSSGANILLRGQTYPSQNSWLLFRSGTTTALTYNNDLNEWTFGDTIGVNVQGPLSLIHISEPTRPY